MLSKSCKSRKYIRLSKATARSAQRDPPQTCAWSGGDFSLAGSCAWRAEVPPYLEPWSGGDFNFTGTAACKVEVPPTSSTSLGGITLGWPSSSVLKDSLLAFSTMRRSLCDCETSNFVLLVIWFQFCLFIFRKTFLEIFQYFSHHIILAQLGTILLNTH